MLSEISETILTIVGPTGVGKTATAIELAQKINGELISADSRQIYRGMDIATGKEVENGQWQQRRNHQALVINHVPIFGLNLVNPDQDFSVVDWLQVVQPVIDEILADGKQPIVVGGTGFYLLALQGKIETLSVKPDPSLRQKLEQLTLTELVGQLRVVDEPKLSLIDVKNKRRLIRAIEMAQYQRSRTEALELKTPAYDLKMIGLTMERGVLYAKVDRRIDQMFKQGLIEETRQLLTRYNRHLPAMSGIGYAEAIAYLDGDKTLAEATQMVKWRTHSYIRRQYTWFRKQAVHWVDLGCHDWRHQLYSLSKSKKDLP